MLLMLPMSPVLLHAANAAYVSRASIGHYPRLTEEDRVLDSFPLYSVKDRGKIFIVPMIPLFFDHYVGSKWKKSEKKKR
jgi:hypothetical protein